MINKKIASEIAVGIILLIAIAVGGIFWVQNRNTVISNQSSVIENQKSVTQEPIKEKGVMCTQDAKLCDDGSYVSRTGPKCEFSACPVSGAAKNGYKIVEVNNPSVQFSFEVPEKWLTETRHSGERELSIAEMNEYLSGYTFPGDFDPENEQEVKKIYFRSDPLFPIASVTTGDNPFKIIYTDFNQLQIDFAVLSNVEAEAEIIEMKRVSKEYGYEDTWSSNEKIGGLSEGVIVYNWEISESRQNSGGKEYFIEVNDTLKTLKISKQAKGDAQFEEDFANLIQTLKIKAL
jgi:hypothetical protein